VSTTFVGMAAFPSAGFPANARNAVADTQRRA
jgi:hypothetical protein